MSSTAATSLSNYRALVGVAFTPGARYVQRTLHTPTWLQVWKMGPRLASPEIQRRSLEPLSAHFHLRSDILSGRTEPDGGLKTMDRRLSSAPNYRTISGHRLRLETEDERPECDYDDDDAGSSQSISHRCASVSARRRRQMSPRLNSN